MAPPNAICKGVILSTSCIVQASGQAFSRYLINSRFTRLSVAMCSGVLLQLSCEERRCGQAWIILMTISNGGFLPQGCVQKSHVVELHTFRTVHEIDLKTLGSLSVRHWKDGQSLDSMTSRRMERYFVCFCFMVRLLLSGGYGIKFDFNFEVNFFGQSNKATLELPYYVESQCFAATQTRLVSRITMLPSYNYCIHTIHTT